MLEELVELPEEEAAAEEAEEEEEVLTWCEAGRDMTVPISTADSTNTESKKVRSTLYQIRSSCLST